MRTTTILGALLLAITNASAAPFAFIPTESNKLTVIDLATSSVATTLRLAGISEPNSIAIPSSADRVYVIDVAGYIVKVIDVASNTVMATIPICADVAAGRAGSGSLSRTFGLGALNPAGTRLVVTCGWYIPEVDVIDTATSKVTKLNSGARDPANVVWNPAGTRFYVMDNDGASISVFDATSLAIVQTITLPPGGYNFSMVFNPAGTRLYVAWLHASPDTRKGITIIDAASGATVGTISLTADPFWIAMSPSGARLYVSQSKTDQTAGSVLVIDTATNAALGTMSVSGSPGVVNVSPDGRRVYVLDPEVSSTSSLQVFDASSLQRVSTIPLPSSCCFYGTFVAPASNSRADALSGMFWNASESGWGISFTERGTNTFAVLYTYDAAGNPKWYTSTCVMLHTNTCFGTMLQTTGPRFFGAPFNPSMVAASTAGDVVITFKGTDEADMTATVNGVAHSVGISRQPLAAGAAQPSIDYTDMWWNPNESGWGMSVTQQNGIAFLAWFVYDNDGQPKWLVATCTIVGTSCSATLYRTTGPGFAPTFDPSAVRATSAGTITVSFTDSNNAVLNYTVDGVSGSKQITRQLF